MLWLECFRKSASKMISHRAMNERSTKGSVLFSFILSTFHFTTLPFSRHNTARIRGNRLLQLVSANYRGSRSIQIKN